MTETSTDGQWYIARDGKQHGPLSDDEMRLFVDGGHLRPSDLVWRPGFSDWRPAPAIFPPAAAPKPKKAAAAATDDATKSLAGDKTKTTTQQPTADTQTTASATTRGESTATSRPTTAGRSHARQARQRHQTDATAGRSHEQPVAQAADEQHPESSAAHASESVAAGKQQRTGSWGRNIAVAALIAVIATGGWLAYQLRDHIADLATAATNLTKQPIAAGGGKKKVAALDTAKQPIVEQKTRIEAPPGKTDQMAFDPRRTGSPLWTLLSREFPDWYADRVEETETLVGKEANTAVTKRQIQALIELRRKHAEAALAASNSKLIAIAATFLANLKSLSDYSTDACYHYISRGESHPEILSLVQTPQHATPIETQVAAVFEAIAEGRSEPKTRERPQKPDYNMLARQLGTLGWSQADLKLFANPSELSKAPPDRVCQMVKDWFTAHLAITDGATQERLLFETLRPVVAG